MKNKRAIITGAGGGLGAASAIVFAERGAKLLLSDINAEAAERVAKSIRDKGGAAASIKADIAHESEVAAMVAECVKLYGGVDILVNCAADLSQELHSRDKDVESMTIEVWDRTFLVNTRGTMLCCKHVLPHMMKAKGGSIVNLASSLALHGQLHAAAYSSSKAAIIQMTRSIAATHGKHGIRCNSVCPGLTETQNVKNVIPEAVRKIIESETLTPRLGRPEELATAIAFLASDDSNNMTGQNLVSDGGLLAAAGIGQMRNLAAGKA